VGRQTFIAYWLIPSEPARSLLRGIINDLARRCDAPVFEPHVTVHVGADRADLAEMALEHVARECRLILLKPLGVDQSDEFTKTLFVQFELNSELRQLNEMIRQSAHDSSQYEVKPHLSLLYKKMSAATRCDLAASITVPFSEISFDALQAIRCGSPTQNAADVEAWQFVSTRRLGSLAIAKEA
jgi:putative hydrolase of the HAD superfamily